MRVRFLYVDNAERLYTMKMGFDSTDSTAYNAVVENARARIRAFNIAAADQTSAVAQTFVSDSGARVEEITEAELVITEEEELYNG